MNNYYFLRRTIQILPTTSSASIITPMIVHNHGLIAAVVDFDVVEVFVVVITFTGEVVELTEVKTPKVVKWLTEAVIVWLTVSILTVVSCSHCPVVVLYQAAYGVIPAGTRLGS